MSTQTVLYHPTEERRKHQKSIADNATTVKFKEKRFRQDQMGRHKQIETIDDNKLHTYRQNNVNIGVLYTENRHKILDTLAKSHTMSDKRFHRIDLAKLRIELTF